MCNSRYAHCLMLSVQALRQPELSFLLSFVHGSWCFLQLSHSIPLSLRFLHFAEPCSQQVIVPSHTACFRTRARWRTRSSITSVTPDSSPKVWRSVKCPPNTIRQVGRVDQPEQVNLAILDYYYIWYSKAPLLLLDAPQHLGSSSRLKAPYQRRNSNSDDFFYYTLSPCLSLLCRLILPRWDVLQSVPRAVPDT